MQIKKAELQLHFSETKKTFSLSVKKIFFSKGLPYFFCTKPTPKSHRWIKQKNNCPNELLPEEKLLPLQGKIETHQKRESEIERTPLCNNHQSPSSATGEINQNPWRNLQIRLMVCKYTERRPAGRAAPPWKMWKIERDKKRWRLTFPVCHVSYFWKRSRCALVNIWRWVFFVGFGNPEDRSSFCPKLRGLLCGDT